MSLLVRCGPPQARLEHLPFSRAAVPLCRPRLSPVLAFQLPSPQRPQPGKQLDKDEDKEQGRKYRRTTFDHAAWASHRSSNRYFRHSKGLLTSRIVRGLAAPLLYVLLISLAVCVYESALADNVLPDWGFSWPNLVVSGQMFSISTFALSLLLVFRTNGSYHRWTEARRIWGGVINRCRDIARQGNLWLQLPEDQALCDALCRWVCAFPLTLMASLREDVELQAALQQVLEADELQHVLRQQHAATAVLQAMGSCVRASSAKDVEKLRIDESISALQDMCGGCERIFRTPIPLSYTRHTSRFLVCWLTLLPFAVADTMGWATVPMACGMAFFLFGIEEIGVQYEEPFGMMACEAFCATITDNVKQAQGAAAAAQQLAAKRQHVKAAAAASDPAAELLPSMQQLVPVMAAGGSSGSGGSERVSGGYTLPRAPRAVNEVLMEEQLFADKSLGHSGDDSDATF